MLTPLGEKIPSYPDDGEEVTCDGCSRTVEVARGTSWLRRADRGWYVRLSVVIPNTQGTVDVQGDVCGECRQSLSFAEVIEALGRKAPGDVRMLLSRAAREVPSP